MHKLYILYRMYACNAGVIVCNQLFNRVISLLKNITLIGINTAYVPNQPVPNFIKYILTSYS